MFLIIRIIFLLILRFNWVFVKKFQQYSFPIFYKKTVIIWSPIRSLSRYQIITAFLYSVFSSAPYRQQQYLFAAANSQRRGNWQLSFPS